MKNTAQLRKGATMKQVFIAILLPILTVLFTGCGLESMIFPMFGPAPLDEPPATLGPYTPVERQINLDDLGDGQPGGITIFEPQEATGQRPTLVWVQGINNHAYYHQSFHEYMASWGYIQVVPDVRPMDFTDTDFNGRHTRIANHAFNLAADNAEGIKSDPDRIAIGGYSAGGSMAAFAAGREPRTRALVMWGPAPAWVWQGIDPNQELPNVKAPSLFLLAEFDENAGDWPAQMQALMSQSGQTVTTIQGGIHMYFQQPQFPPDYPFPTGPPATITLQEEQRHALTITRSFLDDNMDVQH
jgi:dienelactone hydrolase